MPSAVPASGEQAGRRQRSIAVDRTGNAVLLKGGIHAFRRSGAGTSASSGSSSLHGIAVAWRPLRIPRKRDGCARGQINRREPSPATPPGHPPQVFSSVRQLTDTTKRVHRQLERAPAFAWTEDPTRSGQHQTRQD
jgi:hypothetical protein